MARTRIVRAVAWSSLLWISAPFGNAQDVGPTALERRYLDEIADRPYFQYARIDARADGHTLALVGRIGSPVESALAELIARNEPGVGQVRNELEVDPSLPQWRPSPAEEVRTRARNVLRRLRQEPRLTLYTTLRTIPDGKAVLLRGAVASSDEHKLALHLAEEYARPFSVHDELRVDRDASRSAPPPAPDFRSRALENELHTLLRTNALLRGEPPIEVRVRGSRVALLGHLPDLVHHDLAVELVRARLHAHERAQVRPRPLGALERRLMGYRDESYDDTAEVPRAPPAEAYLLESGLIVS
jgi:osmotically-inducible protein OsmY